MRHMQWLRGLRDAGAHASVQLGVYTVAIVAAVTTTLAVVDAAVARLTIEGDRYIAALDQLDSNGRRPPRDDAGEPARSPSITVDRRGYRMIGSAEQSVPTARLASRKTDDASPKISRPPTHGVSAPVTDARREWYSGNGDTFTTVCVRLCDGAIRPVSFSTTPDRFDVDQRTCHAGCSTASRLYVYRNPGESVDTMTDLNGNAYARLKTAYLFQTSYVASCTCRAQPWEQASVDRHRVYALQDKAQRGDARARAELKSLGAKVAALTSPRPEISTDGESGTSAMFMARRAPTTRSARADHAAAPRRSSQVVSSASLGWSGPSVMRLTAPSITSSVPRSGSASSRDPGWRVRLFDAR